SASDLIKGMAPGKNGVILAGVALSGRDVTDLAMAMLFVVPIHELPHPLAGVGQVGKASHREGGMVFAGTEQGFRVGVIVGSIRLFVGEAVEQLYPRACVNRSPNMMANRFIADSQSKAARTDLFSTLRSASHGSLMAASSSGK